MPCRVALSVLRRQSRTGSPANRIRARVGADVHFHARANRDSHAVAHFHADAYADRDRRDRADSHFRAHARAHAYADRNLHADACADRNPHADACFDANHNHSRENGRNR